LKIKHIITTCVALGSVLHAKHINIDDISKDKLIIQYASFNTLKPTIEATKLIDSKYDYYIEKSNVYSIYIVNIDKKNIKHTLKDIKNSSQGAFVKDKKLDICDRANQIDINDNNILSKKEKYNIISPYLYGCIDEKMIEQLTTNISKEYIDRGFSNKKAIFKSQNIKDYQIDISIINQEKSKRSLKEKLKAENTKTKKPISLQSHLKKDEFKLDSLIRSVINQNIDLIFERMSVDISKTYTDEAYGAFEAEFYVNSGMNNSYTKNNTKDAITRNDTDTYKEETSNIDMGLKGVNEYGTRWDIALKSQRTDSSLIGADKSKKAEYGSGLYLEIRQPLLRNFGKDVGEININITKLKTDEAKENYKKQVVELVGKTIASYWRLYSAIEIQKSWAENIKLAQEQQAHIKHLIAAGNMSKIALYEIENSIRNSKIEMLNSQDIVNKERTNLRTLLNISILNNNQKFVPTDKPKIDKIKVPLMKEALSKASENWFDLNIVKQKIKQESLESLYFKNQSKPNLDLIGRVNSTTLEQQYSNSVTKISDNEFNSWYVGVNFSIPVGDNRQANSKIARSKLKLNKLLLEKEKLNNMLENSLSTKILNLKLNKNKMIELQKSVDFRNSMIDIYNEELKFGRIDIEELTNGYKKKSFS
jgi:outer membrane protein TolC